MVDKAPDELKGKEKNLWALDINNKKPSALDMAYPKLKGEAIKNAAKSLGKIFGRDLNRKVYAEKMRLNVFSSPPLPESLKEELVVLAADGKRDALLQFQRLPLNSTDAQFLNTIINNLEP
jgi:hypothetical protein